MREKDKREINKAYDEFIKNRPIIEEFSLGEGIRVYLPKGRLIIAWQKAVKAMDILLKSEETRNEAT